MWKGIQMATLKYYDPFGANQAYTLIGERGVPLSGIINDASVDKTAFSQLRIPTRRKVNLWK
jgi:hypothetical protein